MNVSIGIAGSTPIDLATPGAVAAYAACDEVVQRVIAARRGPTTNS